MAVVEADISISVDGFVTGPNLEQHPGLGEGGDILHADLIDQPFLHVAPVLLGTGTPLFGQLGKRIDLERIEAVETPSATHLRFRIVRRQQ
jgi:hypothetical protein